MYVCAGDGGHEGYVTVISILIAVCVDFLACSNVQRCIEVLGVGEQAIVVGLC